MHVWPIFAVLAVGALIASWRDFDFRPVGVALVASWLGSNLATWYVPLLDRPAAYTVCEVAVLSMAFLAHVCGASRVTVGIVAVCIVSIGLNIRMTTLDAPSVEQIVLWQISTNLCFVVECLLVISAEIYGRYRSCARNFDGGARTFLHDRASPSNEAQR